MFEKEHSTKSKLQTVKDYLKDVEINEKEYNSSMNVMGISSYAKDASIEYWLPTV